MDDAPIISFRRVDKRFPGVRALEEVSFDIARGSCHALCGENGAGKSTLGKLLAGIDVPDGGEILLDGRPVRFDSPRDALAAGVGMVHQELAFCENMSVAENLCLGSLPRRGPFVDRPAVARRARQMLEAIEATIDVHRLVGELTVAEQQVVQIASAVGGGARVIIFDEPALVELMIGRRLDQYLPQETTRAPGEVVLRVDRLSSGRKFHDVSFEVRAGEIVGLAGLVGAGRSEVAQAIFGLDAHAEGRVEVGGQPLRAGSPIAAMRAGLGLVPEDRKRQGFIPQLSGNQNLALPVLPQLARWGWLPAGAERALGEEAFGRLKLRAPNLEGATVGLSGGNQQKIVFAKWLAARCRLLILDEPTRGVDVGAKSEIHSLIHDLAEAGTGILLISSELPELIALSTRMLVLREGRMVGALPRGSEQGPLIRLMAGIDHASVVSDA